MRGYRVLYRCWCEKSRDNRVVCWCDDEPDEFVSLSISVLAVRIVDTNGYWVDTEVIGCKKEDYEVGECTADFTVTVIVEDYEITGGCDDISHRCCHVHFLRVKDVQWEGMEDMPRELREELRETALAAAEAWYYEEPAYICCAGYEIKPIVLEPGYYIKKYDCDPAAAYPSCTEYEGCKSYDELYRSCEYYYGDDSDEEENGEYDE